MCFVLYVRIYYWSSHDHLYCPGNAVLLKPSDVAIHTSNLFMEIIPQYLDKVRHTIRSHTYVLIISVTVSTDSNATVTIAKLSNAGKTKHFNITIEISFGLKVGKGSPTVAKSRTLYLKSHLKSLKSLKFQNLKSRKVETVISKFLYISASNHVGQYQTSS